MKTSITKTLLLIVFTLCSSYIFAQKNWDTIEKTYTNGVALTGLIDVVQSKVLGLKPMGKDVSIKYDPFYDKYTIDWMEEDGAARMVLKFKEENSGGKMYVDTYSDKSNYYFVHNYIDRDNKLTVMAADPVMLEGKKVKLIFVFDDLK